MYTYLDKTYFLELTDEQVNWSCAEALGWAPVYDGPAKPFWMPVEIPLEKWDPLHNLAQCGLILDQLGSEYFRIIVDDCKKCFWKDIWIHACNIKVFHTGLDEKPKYEFTSFSRNRAICFLFLKITQEKLKKEA